MHAVAYNLLKFVIKLFVQTIAFHKLTKKTMEPRQKYDILYYIQLIKYKQIYFELTHSIHTPSCEVNIWLRLEVGGVILRNILRYVPYFRITSSR